LLCAYCIDKQRRAACRTRRVTAFHFLYKFLNVHNGKSQGTVVEDELRYDLGHSLVTGNIRPRVGLNLDCVLRQSRIYLEKRSRGVEILALLGRFRRNERVYISQRITFRSEKMYCLGRIVAHLEACLDARRLSLGTALDVGKKLSPRVEFLFQGVVLSFEGGKSSLTGVCGVDALGAMFLAMGT
jgi:hypothetical protein